MLESRMVNHLLEKRALLAATVGLSVGLLGGILALVLVLVGPLVTFVGVLALGIALLALSNLDFALIGLLAMVALLPFGTMPFSFAFTPSLIDVALGGFLVVYLFQWMTGRRIELLTVPVQWVILGFIMLLTGAFILGIPNAPLTPGVLRRFVGLMVNIALALIIVDVVRSRASLRRVTGVFMVLAGFAALIGIVLWALDDFTADAILSRLGRIGYPSGGVLRYREDSVTILNERAIGTWVDPNAYGGFLMMAAALVAPQLLSRRPVLGHSWFAFGLLGVIGVALFLSDSRGSMLGLATGLGIVALLRYRKLIWLLAAVVVLVLVLPVTQSYIDRMIAGFTGADLETQMRFGEYKDALRLIQRYPVLGVGFAAPPDIDLYIGFASTYLTIAANAGIIGLIAYLITIGSVFVYGYLNRRSVTADHALNDIWFGLLGGIVGALAGGIFDHFYFNIEFQATSLTVWLFIGLFLAATRIANPPDVADRLVMPRLPAAQGGNLSHAARSAEDQAESDGDEQPVVKPPPLAPQSGN